MIWLQRIFIIVAAVLLLPCISAAQLKVYSFEEVEVLEKTAPRSVVVFIHTNWCRYCRFMKSATFKNSKVVKTLSERFYFVELDAEEKKDLFFNNQRFQYKPTGPTTGTHELARALGGINGALTYPVVVMLNKKYEIIFQHSGLLTGKELNAILNSDWP